MFASAGAMGPRPPSRWFAACQCPNIGVHAAIEARGPQHVWSPPRGARSHAPSADIQPSRPLAQIGHSSCDARCVAHVPATRTAMPGHDTRIAGALGRGARVAAGPRVAPQNAKCRWCMESGNSIYYRCSLTPEPRREAGRTVQSSQTSSANRRALEYGSGIVICTFLSVIIGNV